MRHVPDDLDQVKKVCVRCGSWTNSHQILGLKGKF